MANLLYKFAFPIYKTLYYRFKYKQDAFQIELIKKIVSKGDVVFDIGANIGFYSEILSNLVADNGKVHAFEPDRINFNKLKTVINSKNNIIGNNKAVSDSEGKLILYTSDVINVENTTYKPEHFDSFYEVDKISIDQYLPENVSVKFIKMDIQGAELDALNGMKMTLKKNNEIVLMTEVWNYGLKNFGISQIDIFNFFSDLNLKIYLISDRKLKEIYKNDFLNFKNEERYFYNILVSHHSLKYLSI